MVNLRVIIYVTKITIFVLQINIEIFCISIIASKSEIIEISDFNEFFFQFQLLVKRPFNLNE